MDNLDSLFYKKEYSLFLDLTKDSQDPKERLMRISALTILGKQDEALDEIEANQSLIEGKYQLRLMGLHFELLLAKKLYDEARLALTHYQNLPYVSQEVEEFMKDMKERIEDEAHPKATNKIQLDEFYDILEKSTDQSKISQVIFSLKDYNINNFIDSLLILITRNDINPNFRTYGLLLLLDAKLNKEVSFLSRNGLIKVNPSKLTPPFSGNAFNLVLEKIVNLTHGDVSITETALHLFNCYVIDTYPEDIFINDKDDLATAFIIISKKYLNQDISSYDENVLKLSEKIQEIIESTPEIRL